MLGGCIKLYTVAEAFIIELALAVIHSAAHGCYSMVYSRSLIIQNRVNLNPFDIRTPLLMIFINI